MSMIDEKDNYYMTWEVSNHSYTHNIFQKVCQNQFIG